jgi:hypothetical protein
MMGLGSFMLMALMSHAIPVWLMPIWNVDGFELIMISWRARRSF